MELNSMVAKGKIVNKLQSSILHMAKSKSAGAAQIRINQHHFDEEQRKSKERDIKIK